MTDQELAEKVVTQMMEHDAFSRWLGIDIADIKPGYCRLKMTVREEMTNGFSVSHGGIVFSLADSALAFAANSYGKVAVALDNNITFLSKTLTGDHLTAETDEVKYGKRISTYIVNITNQQNKKVATFRGSVYRTQEYYLKN